MPTKPTQIRIPDDDRAKADAIAERYGLPSFSSSVLFAIRETYRRMEGEREEEKKSGKKSKKGD